MDRLLYLACQPDDPDYLVLVYQRQVYTLAAASELVVVVDDQLAAAISYEHLGALVELVYTFIVRAGYDRPRIVHYIYIDIYYRTYLRDEIPCLFPAHFH